MDTARFQPSWGQRLVIRFAYTPLGRWLVARLARPLDRALLKLTGGRRTLVELLTGLPACSVTTLGAKSGLPRTTPLVIIPDGDRFLVVASNFGERHTPAWYYNLKAHPDATLTIAGRPRRCQARELTGEAYRRAWAIACAFYPGYEYYRRRASHRPIPVMELRRLPDDEHNIL